MEYSLVDQHWMWLFGVNAGQFATPITVVAHGSPFFEDYNGAWIWEHDGRWILTVPSALRDEVAAKIETISPDWRLTEEGARELFGDRITRVIGPAYQGAVEPSYFKPFTNHTARLLTSEDRHALETLLSECDVVEVEDSGVRVDSIPLHGCFVEGRLAAVAKEIDISPYAMAPGILTHPALRGHGYGKAAVSAAVEAIFLRGKVVCYQTLIANSPSVGIVRSLGGRDYARHLAVRLRM